MSLIWPPERQQTFLWVRSGLHTESSISLRRGSTMTTTLLFLMLVDCDTGDRLTSSGWPSLSLWSLSSTWWLEGREFFVSCSVSGWCIPPDYLLLWLSHTPQPAHLLLKLSAGLEVLLPGHTSHRCPCSPVSTNQKLPQRLLDWFFDRTLWFEALVLLLPSPTGRKESCHSMY